MDMINFLLKYKNPKGILEPCCFDDLYSLSEDSLTNLITIICLHRSSVFKNIDYIQGERILRKWVLFHSQYVSSLLSYIIVDFMKEEPKFDRRIIEDLGKQTMGPWRVNYDDAVSEL
jgi:hypothetical protein